MEATRLAFVPLFALSFGELLVYPVFGHALLFNDSKRLWLCVLTEKLR